VGRFASAVGHPAAHRRGWWAIEMMQLQARLPTGRPVMIMVPADISAMEALSLVSWVAGVLTQKIAERSAGRILVPSH
jgi:hypothetical protein